MAGRHQGRAPPAGSGRRSQTVETEKKVRCRRARDNKNKRISRGDETFFHLSVAWWVICVNFRGSLDDVSNQTVEVLMILLLD